MHLVSGMIKLLRGQKTLEEMEGSDKLKLIDSELLSFYDYCKQMGFSEDEIDRICSPLNNIIQKNNLRKLLKTILIIFGVFGMVYLATCVEFVDTHATALGRIAMIKLLPLWNWKPLFYEVCIVQNPFYGEYRLTEDDCMSCENVEEIDVVSEITYDVLTSNYINMDAPVIVTDAMTDWPSMTAPVFDIGNITEIFLDEDKTPCEVSSNLRTASPTLSSFMKRIRKPHVDKWFIHWKNCDIHTVKALRKFYFRPYFMANTVSPAHFNWVLMSSGYFSTNYKRIEVDNGLIMLSQFRGETSFRLIPVTPCNASCPELYGSVQQGEILIFLNYLWNLEYYPGSRSDNIAILTETIWEDEGQT